MTDQIGTIRKETHDPGYSLWVHLVDRENTGSQVWACVFSTSAGNLGNVWPGNVVHIADRTDVVGILPGMEE